MTPDQINSSLRKTLPGFHRVVRNAATMFLANYPAFPLPAIPRTLDEKRVWVHPRFLTTPLDVEPAVRTWLTQYLHTGSTFFDVGAYAGWHSLYAARIVGKEGRVVAFEASPANARYLAFHRRKNRLSQLNVVACAVTDCPEGRLEFNLLNGGDSTSNSIQRGEAYTRSQANQSLTQITVPTTTLDAEAISRPPDLVKIDVEGAELLVLEGARLLMTKRRPPIILALHPTWLPNGASATDVVRLLHDRDYEIFEPDGSVAADLRFSDYLCLPNERGGARTTPQLRL